MKIVRLEPDRVRVFLSELDLFSMNIDIDSITADSSKLSVFLYEVLAAVKAQTGFSLEDGQVLAEATPKPDGVVLELFRAKKEEDAVKTVKRDSVVFEIADFDSLSLMLKNISSAYLLNMRLYLLDGAFYVAVPKRRVPPIIFEYSIKNRKMRAFEAYLSEYGRLVAGGYRLICMAAALKKIN